MFVPSRTLLALGLILALGFWTTPLRAAGSADVEFFEKKIRPALDTHCNSCHTKGKTRGGLSLANRAALLKGGDSGPAVVPGQPAKSLLIQAVRHEKDDLHMPPKGKLPPEVINDFITWVEHGAVWPEALVASTGDSLLRTNGMPISAKDREFWSFRPVTNPAVPKVKDAGWPQKSLDYFILATMEEKGLKPVRQADRRTLIRRLSFDLVGLPPTPEEVEAFVDDRSPDAYAKLVERLLASPHYGERWARHWLDVARYGEDQAHTFQARLYPNGYRYRDWVIKAFNDNMPYDQFIVNQIAADQIEGPKNRENLPALGYFALGPVYYADAGEAKAAQAAEVDDRIDTLCRGFLGLTVACARCHDHKFDPIPTADYYGLAGIFFSTQYDMTSLASPEETKRFSDSTARVKSQEEKVKKYLEDENLHIAENLADNLPKHALAAWKLHAIRKGQPGPKVTELAKDAGVDTVVLERLTNFLFGKEGEGKGTLADWHKATRGLDPKNSDTAKKIEEAANALRDRAKQLLHQRDEANKSKKKLDKLVAERLKEWFGAQGFYQVPANMTERMLSAECKKELAAMRADLDKFKKDMPAAPPMVHALKEGNGADMKIFVRGNWRTEGDVAPRRFLRILSGDNPAHFSQGSGRLELAKAIATRDNPLTARVMANRLWMHHFGKGIVGTPSNFGLLGERPTHPELLDHLASKFVASGWSIKDLHREIVLSATYQLDSTPSADAAKTDPANRLYSHRDRRKLDVEAWRDALLMASGQLELTIGGPSRNLNDGNNFRRTLYGSVSRHDLSGLLRLFDFPDPNLTSEKRTSTTVPVQQLFVINSEFMADRAKSLAKKLATDAPSDEARIRLAFSRLFGRPAKDWEVKLGLDFLTARNDEKETKGDLSRWEEYAQVLLGVNEFAFVD
jgi:cytochrome c553